MFTGIVRAIGAVKSVHKISTGCKIVVDISGIADASIQLGDSIAVNGACLTVTKLHAEHASFDISAETIARCLVNEWQVGKLLNLEPALTLQTPLGGHLVSGHIDDVGRLVAHHPSGEFTRMQFEAPRAVGQFIANKGAIAVDGVSLTVNEISDAPAHTRFTVMVVPHTLATTTLGKIQPRARVHLEVDLLSRYTQRLLDSRGDD